MKAGVVQQQDSARTLYDEPVNFFAADFIGSPPINKLYGTMEGGAFHFSDSRAAYALPLRRPVADGTQAVLAVRAESVLLPAQGQTLHATVLQRYSIGKDELSVLEVEGQKMRGYISGDYPIKPGDALEFGLKKKGVFLFDVKTGERLS